MTISGVSPRPEAPAGFPGFGEDAPLDLSHLTATAEAGIIGRLRDGSLDAWADTAAAVGYCSRPIRLIGSSTTVDAATGEVLSSFASREAPLGVLHRPCGNRRADVCPSCSRIYGRDTFAMINAGMVGGKTVPESVADNPLLFVTFTAPSFGHVHGPRPKNGKNAGGRCRPRDKTSVCVHGRPTGCMQIHGEDDPANGAPLCWDCYDWASAVVWQWWAPELWRRATIAIRRRLAKALSVKEKDLRDVGSLQFAKVAEFQARGMVHFHALIRLDGPDGTGSPAPLDGQALADLVEAGTRSVVYTAPAIDPDDTDRVLAWGQQLDIRVVRQGRRTDDPTGPLMPEQVAGYLAKYATKDANSLRDGHKQPPHLAKISRTCRELVDRAKAADPKTPYRKLGDWAHMLGFRGHFSTKSRRYSTTLGRLRRARHRYQTEAAAARRTGQALDTRDLEARLLADDDEATLVVGSWAYQGTGWTRPGDEALALAAAARAREYAQWRADQSKTKQHTNSGR